MKKEELKNLNLPIGSHYFEAVFDSVEEARDTIGYFMTYDEALRACKNFADFEIEYFYNGEFDVLERVVEIKDGKRVGHRVNAWSNEHGLNMYQYIQDGKRI